MERLLCLANFHPFSYYRSGELIKKCNKQMSSSNKYKQYGPSFTDIYKQIRRFLIPLVLKCSCVLTHKENSISSGGCWAPCLVLPSSSLKINEQTNKWKGSRAAILSDLLVLPGLRSHSSQHLAGRTWENCEEMWSLGFCL